MSPPLQLLPYEVAQLPAPRRRGPWTHMAAAAGALALIGLALWLIHWRASH